MLKHLQNICKNVLVFYFTCNHLLCSTCVFLPARRYASAVFATATCPDVRLSVCLSVTRRYCAKTVHFRHKVTIGRTRKTVVTCKIKHLQNICKNVLLLYFTCNHPVITVKHLENICKNVLEVGTCKTKH